MSEEDDMNQTADIIHINRMDEGGNATDEEFRDLYKTLDEIADEREVLTNRKNTAIGILVEKGEDKGALAAAYRRYKTDEHKRKKFDMTYIRATEAVNVQHQLFDEDTEADSQE